MKNTMKKIICSVLTVLMFVSVVPFVVSGANVTAYPPYPEIEYSYTPDVKAGTIRYISQIASSSKFNSNYWGSWVGSADGECGTASISMALSYVGINKTPQAVLDAHSGETYFTGWGVTTETPDISTGVENFANGNGKYSPLIVHFTEGYDPVYGHWVLFIGKVSENSYLVLGPDEDNPWVISTDDYRYKSINERYQYYNPDVDLSVNDFDYAVLEDGTVEITKYKGASKDIVIPDRIYGKAVTKLAAYSLANLGAINSLTIPATFRSFGKDCFANTQIKDKVVFLGTMLDWCTKIGYDWDNSQPLKDGAKLYIGNEFIEHLVLPEGLTELSGRTFFAYKHLKNIVFPSSLKTIHAWAFIGCSGIESLIIPDNVERINYGAFQLCTSLKKVYIGKGLTTVESDTFYLCSSINEVFYNGTKDDWKKISFGRLNGSLTNVSNFHYNFNAYNLGEETYQFKNYSDSKSSGHCFGMSMTSSGYYLGKLDISDIGGNNKDGLHALTATSKVKSKICDYQKIQGSIRDAAMVAGGTNYKNSKKYDIKGDWKEVIDYVKNHDFDYKGSLQIGYKGKYTNKDGKLVEGGHAINFIRYEVVNGQQRIYAYDNNMPTVETYFYQNENGEVLQAPYATFSGPIDCIALRNVSTYFTILKGIDIFTALNKPLIFYAFDKSISIEGAYTSMMDGVTENGVQYMYEIPEGQTEIKIIPLVDNAKFTYMDEEYSFGKIDETTYAELTLATEDSEVEFNIVNEPPHTIHTLGDWIEVTPSTCEKTGLEKATCLECDYSEYQEIAATGHDFDGSVCKNCNFDRADSCGCKCHKTGIISKIIWFITNFFNKLLKKNQVCDCGKVHF